MENIIIFLLPTQLGLHFWPFFSRVAGVRIDYLSPTLYILDVFLLLYALGSLRKIIKVLNQNMLWLMIWGIFIITNILFGVSILNSIMWWSRSLLYFLTFITFRQNKISWTRVKTPLLFSTSLIILLQVIQIITTHSIGGIFYYFGERAFTGSSSGLAHVSIFGLDFIRPPSFFSHPNSLAGYLVVVYFLMNHFKSPFWQRLIVFGSILLTVSKAALLALSLVILLKVSPLFIISGSLVFSVIQIFFVKLPSSLQFISDRLYLLTSVPQIILTHSLFGVGLGNFVVALGNTLPGSHLILAKIQPVHNLPYLIFTEFGLVGLFLMLACLYKIRRMLFTRRILTLLAVVTLIGCFDHYFWTLPQNRLIILLALSLML